MKKILVQQFYEDSNPQRNSEILYTLIQNINSRIFDDIILLTEGDCPTLSALRGFTKITTCNRVTYLQALSYCKDSDCIYIIANNDIYFDETLHAINKVKNWEKLVVTVTRFDLSPEGKLRDYRVECDNVAIDRATSDAWIVKGSTTPTKHFAFKGIDEIEFGWLGCECVFAQSVAEAGWRLLNAHPEVVISHVHWSQLRRVSTSKAETSYRLQGYPCLRVTDSLFACGDSLV